MKRIIAIALSAALFLAAAPAALAQEQQEPDMETVINNQIDNLTRTFSLDEVQVFFLDSILTHNFNAMMVEMQEARKVGASNADTYQGVSDKWMDATDIALEKIMTKEQWAKYMKSSYGKEKKRRDKRIAERGGISKSRTGTESGEAPKRR